MHGLVCTMNVCIVFEKNGYQSMLYVIQYAFLS